MRSYPLLIVYFLLWSCHSTWAQDANRRDLQAEVDTTQSDTARILLLNEIAQKIPLYQSDSSLRIVHSAMQEAKMIGFTAGYYELLITAGSIHSGIKQMDSAMTLFLEANDLAIAQQNHTREAIALRSIGHVYNAINQKNLALTYLHKGLNKAQQTTVTNEELVLEIYNAIGLVHSYRTEYDSSVYYLNLVLQLHQKAGNQTNQINTLINLGNNYARANRLEEAFAHYKKAIQLAQKTGNRDKESTGWNMMAYTSFIYGNYPQALEYYQKALTIEESQNHPGQIIRILEQMGDLYVSMEDLPTAFEYYERAFEYYDQSDTKGQKALLAFKRGELQLLKENYQEALSFYQQALQLRKDNQESLLSETEYFAIGICYEQLGQLDSAQQYMQQAVDLAQVTQSTVAISNTLVSLGRIYFGQGKQESARKVLEEGKNAALAAGQKEREMEAAVLLYQIYKVRNNKPEALLNLELTRQIQDSLFNSSSLKKIARLEADHAFEKERQELAIESARQRYFNQLTAGALSIAILLIGVFAWSYRAKKRSNVQLEQLNEEINYKNVQLEELDQLKSRFFTNISHELRTPLTVIGGMAEQIKQEPEKWLDRGIELIRRNNSNLLHLVNQILDLRKLESGNLNLDLVQADIIPYLREVCGSFQPLAESKGLQLQFLAGEETLIMDFDKEKVLRVISNLLSNAIKFTEEGGEVHLVIARGQRIADEDGKTGNLLSPSGLLSSAVLTVQDSGIGIPPEKLPNVFDRFYQVDDTTTRGGEGTGIGLALSRELVRLMGGEITLESILGKGSTFTIQLPVTNKAEPDQEKNATSLQQGIVTAQKSQQPSALPIDGELEVSDRPTLLVVEDNPDLVQYLRSFLEKHFRLSVAKNGEEGIQKALEEVPDLIVSDLMMPKKDGLEVCQTLKADQTTSHIPIVLLTAKADVSNRIAGFKRGADAYLAKPFHQQELVVRLQKLLEMRRHLQQRYQNLSLMPPTEDVSIRREDEFISKLTSLVEAQMENEHFGVPELRLAMGMSKSQLHRKVRALTGQPPSLFIRSVRLKKARTLLQTTDLNISQVAYEVGFRDPNYFSRAFAEVFGLKPSEARNN